MAPNWQPDTNTCMCQASKTQPKHNTIKSKKTHQSYYISHKIVWNNQILICVKPTDSTKPQQHQIKEITSIILSRKSAATMLYKNTIIVPVFRKVKDRALTTFTSRPNRSPEFPDNLSIGSRKRANHYS